MSLVYKAIASCRIHDNSFMQTAAGQGYSSQGGMSSYLQVGSFLVLTSLFGA